MAITTDFWEVLPSSTVSATEQLYSSFCLSKSHIQIRTHEKLEKSVPNSLRGNTWNSSSSTSWALLLHTHREVTFTATELTKFVYPGATEPAALWKKCSAHSSALKHQAVNNENWANTLLFLTLVKQHKAMGFFSDWYKTETVFSAWLRRIKKEFSVK